MKKFLENPWGIVKINLQKVGELIVNVNNGKVKTLSLSPDNSERYCNPRPRAAPHQGLGKNGNIIHRLFYCSVTRKGDYSKYSIHES